MLLNRSILALIFFACLALTPASHKVKPGKEGRLEILFLGHKSKHHDSDKLASILLREYFKDGINISYTVDPNDLTPENLSHYDGLIVYANHDTITSSQEKALLDFVKSGKGFIPLHCASWCFRNSPEVVDLIGGQFKTHKYDSFPSVITRPEHPVMKGVEPFYTKDETYVHDKMSSKITVLSTRKEGDREEPYTWVRTYGEGRVFYTAYGHDDNTFLNKQFLQLVKNGIFWAVGDKAKTRVESLTIANPKYFDGPVPNYEKRDPAPKVQESLSPEQSMSLMQVPVGFELQLFAAEPMVVNPIYINWDEKGRLWVIETVDYPNELKEDDIGDDRIKILEDTDGDGKADKATIFAEKLNIPTSFMFVNGGIMVSCAPSFLFLKDTNGDDKADVRQNVLPGWGKWDTHAQASNLRYGMDNKIWGVVGYSGFKGKVGNDSLKFGQGVYRFTPDGKWMDYITTTSNNTWGLGFTEEFDVFVSTANNTHSGFVGLPKRYFDKIGMKQSGFEKVDAHYAMHVATKNLRQVDVHGGFTAAAGHGIYTARNFPKDFWNRSAFVTEPTGRLVHRTNLKQQGAGFKEEGDGWNMLVSADEWAGPIQAEVGPDGALWITDWYDFIIQHNPTPSAKSAGYQAENGKGNAYVNPLRDHERGRIYRIAYKGNDQRNTFSLDKNDVQGLLRALSNNNMFWRMHAQRLLVERGDKSVIPSLYKLVQNEKLDEIGLNAPAIHALWTLQGLKAFEGSAQTAIAVATKALSHPAGGVRKAAIDVLPKNVATLLAMQKAGSFNDKDFRVRLAALLSTADMNPSPAIARIAAVAAADKENIADKWITHALTVVGKRNETEFRKMMTANGLSSLPDSALGLYKAGKVEEPKQETGKVDQTIIIKVLKDVMKYDRQLLTAKAGTTVRFVFENPDFMQHNLLLLQPKSMEKVGAAADKLAQDPNGPKMNYVPKMPEVLAATPLINPGAKYSFTVKIPDTAGDYPYVCTFPGHWRLMNGILRVTK